MSEPGLGGRADAAKGQRGVPGEGAEADKHAQLREQLELAARVGQAAVALGWCRTICRRGAAHRCGDEAAVQLEAVAAGARGRLVRESGPVERGVEEVPRAVAGEDATGAVGAVSCWGETEDRDPRGGVAEPRDRPAPVGLVGKGGAALARDMLAPGDEPWAVPAILDPCGKRGEVKVA